MESRDEDVSLVTAILNSLNGTNSTPSPLSPSPPPPSLFCTPWAHTGHLLFYISHVALLISFCLPYRELYQIVTIQVATLVAFSANYVWSAFRICTLDMSIWNGIIIFVNFAQFVHMLFAAMPQGVNRNMKVFYKKVFEPIQMSPSEFKNITTRGTVSDMMKNELYADEGATPSGGRISVLLAGSMIVMWRGLYLHHIEPGQFIDSPEWIEMRRRRQTVFQVTIRAEADCRLLSWTREELEFFFEKEAFYGHVMTSVIGKDVTSKLYRVNERIIKEYPHRFPDIEMSTPPRRRRSTSDRISFSNVSPSLSHSPSASPLHESSSYPRRSTIPSLRSEGFLSSQPQ